ncbi:MAG: alpha/beta hydrolase [Bryobacteraceae bacterium]|nr:alpha/beta hydrolase [Bryobacteraceae bacterium]
MRRNLKTILRWTWILAGFALTAWMIAGFQASGVPDESTKGDGRVAVTAASDGIEFRIRANPRSSGLIFLPGGMVDPTAYAPLMKRIAAAGHPVHLLYLPWRCACTESQVGDLFRNIQSVMAAEPATNWALAGHSRGGMLASRFEHQNGGRLAGLVLIGTTHPRDFSLAGRSIPVVKIYGTNDGIASYSGMRRNQHLLPANTGWIGIEGGNHVQFGYYRHQLGDGAASISREDQQLAVERALLRVLAGTGGDPGH